MDNAISRTVHSRRVYIGMTVAELAARSGMSLRSFQLKMQRPERMTLEDAWKIEAALSMEHGTIGGVR